MERMKNFWKHWNWKEITILVSGLVAVTVAFVVGNERSVLAYVISVLSVISTIVIAKGFVIAPVIDLLPTTLYVFLAVFERFYGEVIIYVGLLIPIGIFTVVKWLTHRDEKYKEFVVINKISQKEIWGLSIGAILMWIFTFFVLKLLSSSQIIYNTFSLVFCAVACYLMYRRSPYYSILYICYDIMAILMWIGTISSDGMKYLPTIISCIIFIISDIYGFYWWKVCEKKQSMRRKKRLEENNA